MSGGDQTHGSGTRSLRVNGIFVRRRVQYDGHLLKQWSGTMAEANDSNRRSSQGDASATRDLVVDGLPTCTIQAAANGTWQVMAQLASDEEAALAAAAPSPDDLCRQAQHALGLAGTLSRIDRERGAIGVYADRSGAPFGEPTLIVGGPAVLWAFGHAMPDAIRALLRAATEAMRQSPDP
jgi:hypothetical protein